MNKAQSGWTEDRLAKLRELWDKKLSITKIGEELGVSRNAVAGKAHRLGLEKRQSPIKPSIKPKTSKNNSKPWPQMAPSGPKWVQIVPSGPKWLPDCSQNAPNLGGIWVQSRSHEFKNVEKVVF